MSEQKFSDLMIDIESMGTTPGSIILSIGAVAFDMRTLAMGAEFNQRIHLGTSQRAGLTMDASTILWWFKQSREAQDNATKGALPIRDVIEAFTEFCKGVAPTPDLRPWGNGASFDAPLIEAVYRQLGMETQIPWRFHNARCFRTLKAMYPQVQYPERVGVHHDALDDAKYQVECAFAIRRFVAARNARIPA